MSTHNLCFGSKIRKKNCKPHPPLKSGLMGYTFYGHVFLITELSLFVDFTVKTMNESMSFWIAVVLLSTKALTPATGSGAEDFAGMCLSTYKKDER